MFCYKLKYFFFTVYCYSGLWSRLLESTVIWIPGCCWLCRCVHGRFGALLAGAIAITVFVWLKQHSVLRSTGVRQNGVVLGGENRAWSRSVGRHLCDQRVPGLNVSVQSHFFFKPCKSGPGRIQVLLLLYRLAQVDPNCVDEVSLNPDCTNKSCKHA